MMKKRNFLLMVGLFTLAIIAVHCTDDESLVQTPEMTLKKGGKPVPATEVGNNLSYPVIWAEGVTKVLQGTPGMTPLTAGVWWYQWGTNGEEPDVTPVSCPPDPDESNLVLNPDGLNYCDDGITGSLTLPAGEPVADHPLPLARAYIQKDAKNIWQAGTADWSAAQVNVNWVDWGDNLESVNWYTRSQVRTEMVLIQDLAEVMLEYQMRHTSGWGIDEVHGMATDLLTQQPLLGAGTQATVYSHCARLTIQKLLVTRDDPKLSILQWVPGEGWTEPPGSEFDIINPHIFNGSVHEGGDGPGYYSAEINVKGKIIYGYTWNVRTLNDPTPVEGSDIRTAAGDYRITFSFDNNVVGVPLNTFFTPQSQIVIPLEEEVEAAVMIAEADDSGDEGGGTGVLDHANNLTYIDVRILERGGGGSRKK